MLVFLVLLLLILFYMPIFNLTSCVTEVDVYNNFVCNCVNLLYLITSSLNCFDIVISISIKHLFIVVPVQ